MTAAPYGVAQGHSSVIGISIGGGDGTALSRDSWEAVVSIERRASSWEGGEGLRSVSREEIRAPVWQRAIGIQLSLRSITTLSAVGNALLGSGKEVLARKPCAALPRTPVPREVLLVAQMCGLLFVMKMSGRMLWICHGEGSRLRIVGLGVVDLGVVGLGVIASRIASSIAKDVVKCHVPGVSASVRGVDPPVVAIVPHDSRS